MNMGQVRIDSTSKISSVPLAESLFVILLYVVFSTQLLRLLFAPLDVVTNPASVKFAYISLYMITFLFFFLQPLQEIRRSSFPPLLLLLVFFPLFSVLWSVNPEISLIRVVQLLGSTLFAFYLGGRFSPNQFLHLFAIGATVSALLSIFFVLFIPEWGLSHDPAWPDAWRGASGHKNGLGSMSALSGLILLAAIQQDQSRQWIPIFWAGFIINMLLILKSQSTTSIFMFIFSSSILLFIPLTLKMKRDYLLLFTVAILSFFLLMITIVFSEGFSSLMQQLTGKSGNLSGRLPLWNELIPFIKQRYWFGYGYSVFWEKGYLPVRIISSHLFFTPAYSHNGILETWLNIGLVGVVLLLMVFAKYSIMSIRIAFHEANTGIWTIALPFLVMFLLGNFSESQIFAANNIQWCLFVALYIQLTRFSCRNTKHTY